MTVYEKTGRFQKIYTKYQCSSKVCAYSSLRLLLDIYTSQTQPRVLRRLSIREQIPSSERRFSSCREFVNGFKGPCWTQFFWLTQGEKFSFVGKKLVFYYERKINATCTCVLGSQREIQPFFKSAGSFYRFRPFE